MAVVSDFDVVAEHGFLRNRDGEYVITTGGHTGNWPAVLDCSLLGGYSEPRPEIYVRFLVNDHNVGFRAVRRRTGGIVTFGYDLILLPIRRGIVRHRDWGPLADSPNNTLRIVPLWHGSSDHLFVGPIVCHFQQDA